MEKGVILAKLIDEKKAAILRTLLNSADEMYLKEISERSKVPIATTFRILKELVNLKIINKKEWKTSKLYHCEKNEKVEFLRELFHEEYDGLKEFVALVKDMPSIQQIIMHDARKKGKANILLIGEGINKEPLEKAKQLLKENHFELSYLSLTKEQYEQMVEMGLYSGEKTILK